jgi:uncharacterized protein YjbI with pentapeptide repeats
MKIKSIIFLLSLITIQSNATVLKKIRGYSATAAEKTSRFFKRNTTPKIYKNTSMQSKTLSGKNFSEYTFDNVKMIAVDFRGSCAQDAKILNSKITLTNMSSQNTILNQLKKTIYNRSELFAKNKINIEFSHSNLINVNLSGNVLIDSMFYSTALINCNFENIIAMNSNFLGCLIVNTSFVDSVLMNADFSATILRDVDFTDSILFGADFEGAIFENVSVDGVDFRGTTLSEEQKEYLRANGAENVDWENQLL